jgi:hypothetical protein
MKRTYRPHIRVQIGPRYSSLFGWMDWSAILPDWRWWECVGHGAEGSGATPKEAYDAWYRDFIRPYNTNPIILAAFRATQTPQFPLPKEQP